MRTLFGRTRPLWPYKQAGWVFDETCFVRGRFDRDCRKLRFADELGRWSWLGDIHLRATSRAMSLRGLPPARNVLIVFRDERKSPYRSYWPR